MAPIIVGVNGGDTRIYAGVTLVAFARGYFARQGLDVQLVESGSYRENIPLLNQGKLDVSPEGPTLHFFRGWDPSRPMLMVADHGSKRPGRGTGALIARTELIERGLLQDCADLRGKRIGLSPNKGDHDWLEFDAALRLGGLTFADVHIVPIDFGAGRLEALATGEIDLFSEGVLRRLIDAKRTREFTVWKYRHEVCAGSPERTVVFGYAFWSERPEEARRYVLAYLQGLRDYYAAFEQGINRAEIEDLIAEQSGYSREAVAQEFIPTSVNPDGFMNVGGIAKVLKWFEQEQLLPRPVPLDQVIQHRYVEEALAELGPYQPEWATGFGRW